eukprot:m.139731 g.139731  ORF g.139731 m.139731 type:complete len:372 (-) comp15955_c1_seq3:170-1285(-)
MADDFLDDADLELFSMDAPQSPPPRTPVTPQNQAEEFGDFGDFGFDDPDLDGMGFGDFGDEIEATTTRDKEEIKTAHEQVQPKTDEEAFETLGVSDEEDEEKILQTTLNSKFPCASQGFRGPAKENQVLSSITFYGVQMVEKGSFNLEIRTKTDGKGKCLGEMKNLDASKLSLRKTLTFREPIAMDKNTPYHLHLVLNSGSFKFQVGGNKEDKRATGARYRFRPAAVEHYVRTTTDTSYLLRTKFTGALEADPKRGELSNWLEHTKTAQKKGTIARRLSIRKRHANLFFVLEGFELKYYAQVDGELEGVIKLTEVQEVTGQDDGLVMVLILKSCEHAMKARSVVQNRIWMDAINDKLKQIQASFGKTMAEF